MTTQATTLVFLRVAQLEIDGYRFCAYRTGRYWYAYKHPLPVAWAFVWRWGVRLTEAEAGQRFPELGHLPYQSSSIASDEMAEWFSPTGPGIPIVEMSESEFGKGYPLPSLLETLGLAKSHSAARRLTQQGGVYLEEKREGSISRAVCLADFVEGKLLVRVGRNDCRRVKLYG